MRKENSKTPMSDAYRRVLASPVPGDAHGRTWGDAIRDRLRQKALAGDKQAAIEVQRWNRRFWEKK
jgi:hypothetical protein